MNRLYHLKTKKNWFTFLKKVLIKNSEFTVNPARNGRPRQRGVKKKNEIVQFLKTKMLRHQHLN